MAAIVIKRPSKWTNGFRNYKIYIDGKLLTKIANGETKKLHIKTVGPQTINATLDWGSSPDFLLEIAQHETKKLVVDIHPETSKKLSLLTYTSAGILVLDFLVKEMLDIPYTILLFVFPVIFTIYIVLFFQKKMLIIEEIKTIKT